MPRLKETIDKNKLSRSSVFQSLHTDKPIQMALEEAYNYLQVCMTTFKWTPLEKFVFQDQF